ncbi:MAG: protein-disulfide reductase DsbD [Pseudomonadota bacterium]
MISRILRLALIGIFASMNFAHAQTDSFGEELLDPEVAFASAATMTGDGNLKISFDIAEGYYLYRKKFAFSSLSDGVTLGAPSIPAGKVEVDEFFGEVETYRDKVSITVPVVASDGVSSFVAQIQSQGCADIGVCYPPLKQEITVAMLPAPSNTSTLSSLLSLASSDSGEPDILSPEQAFPISVLPVRNGELPVRWDIAEGYYLYDKKLSFALENGSGVTLGEPVAPTGEVINDAYFGESEIHRGELLVKLPLNNFAAPIEANLVVGYQGCADLGICYPPQKQSIPVNLTPAGTATAPTTTAALTEQDRIAATIANESLFWTVLIFLALGIGLAFTPCVFPMVPILSSIIVGQGDEVTTGKAFRLSLVYVLAMAVTYTIAGVAVGLSGENIQIWFQNPWVISAFAILFALLSLSMFGFYDLQIPASWQSRLTSWSNSQKGGTYAGVGIMGFLSALIVGPCITAPLVGALIYIAETGDAVLGGAALFALSVGMGIPLMIIGTSAGTLLPKAGQWMDGIKAVFGILLLALAIWMLERILPLAATMGLAALLLIASAVYLKALEPLPEANAGWRAFRKSIGIVLLAYGLMLAVGAASGGASFFTPLKGLFIGGNTQDAQHLEFKQIKGVEGLQAELSNSRANGSFTMLDFYADWCISCKEMEAFTFTDERVQAHLREVKLLQSDVTQNDEVDQALLGEIGIFGPPAILFFSPDGNEIPNSRVVGFMNAERFASHLSKLLAR